MNPQTPSSPQPNPEQAPNPGQPEIYRPAVTPEAAAAPVTPTPTAPVAPHLSRDDVAAAIAAMPAVGAPPVSAMPSPATAADEDVLEMEWVQKTEEVIGNTAGDPRAQEEAIEDLQVDYLQKRYGHNVKKPGDE